MSPMDVVMPANWEEVTIREICLRTTNWNPLREHRDEIWYIDVSAVSRESYAIRLPQRIEAVEAPSRARKIIHTGDTIFATVRPRLRRVALIGKEFDNQIVSTAFCVVRGDREKTVPRFLYYLLLTDHLNEEIAKLESGASYPAVNDKDVLDRRVWLPPVLEQEKIAAVLWKVQAAIDVEEKLLATATELKRSTMHQLFTHGLRGESLKETSIGPLPESWNPRLIGELCEIWSGGTPRKSILEYWGGVIPWVSGKDLKSPHLDDAIDHVSAEGVAAGSRIAPADSVLLLVRGMGLAKDLPVAVINRPMAFNQDIKALVSRGIYSGQFIRSAIYAGKQRLLDKIVPSAHGTMTLNLNDVETFEIACPSNPAESEEIVSILRTLDSKISTHERKRATLQELLQTLLHKLMTGQIRVDKLDIDTSEVSV